MAKLLNRLHGGQLFLCFFPDISYLLNRLHGGQLMSKITVTGHTLLNRLHGGQLPRNAIDTAANLLNRLHGGQRFLIDGKSFRQLLNRLHGGQLERYETISLSFKGLHLGHPPIASFVSPLFNYFIPKGFSEQLFYEAKRKLQKR